MSQWIYFKYMGLRQTSLLGRALENPHLQKNTKNFVQFLIGEEFLQIRRLHPFLGKEKNGKVPIMRSRLPFNQISSMNLL
jgi:hypothetical protein